jgi:protein arginine N-methyltransferase 1
VTPLDEHLGYVSDTVRLKAYRAALARTVREGARVADLGCGTGVLGLMALEAGAARVFAIDASEMIDAARASFARAGFRERAAFFRTHSMRAELPERVDLVVCDQVGYFGFDAGIVPSFADAARRFLKPGGTLVPARLKIFAAAVESAECYQPVAAWEGDAVPAHLRWLREYAVNARHAARITTAELLGPPVLLGELDLYADEPAMLSWKAALPVERTGTLHGVAGWFECELAPGVWMTNSPLAEQAINRPQAFLPIGEPVGAGDGGQVALSVMAKPRDEIIVWTVELPSGRRFKHSTWEGVALSREHLARADPGRVPQPNREGRARMIVLSYCDGRRTAREIEQQVLADHPDLFPSPDETVRFVAHVLARDAGAW